MKSQIQSALAKVQVASRELPTLEAKAIDRVLKNLASALEKNTSTILAANRKDLSHKDPQDPTYDRLKLTPERIRAMAKDLRSVARLRSPLHQILEKRTLPNGLKLEKRSVPLGVIGMIYEARPNVTVDAFALCFKTGNACVLKGGSDATFSNRVLVKIIQRVLGKHRINQNAVLLLPTDRNSVSALLAGEKYVDVIIPRGSQALIDMVRRSARVPVIETGAGIVHTYVDRSADLRIAARIIENAKTRRPSVCNALDTLLIHQSLVNKLPVLLSRLHTHRVRLFADTASYRSLTHRYDDDLLEKASPKHYGTEFLSLQMSIKTVKDIDQAIAHITQYGSKHSEAVIAKDPKVIEKFLNLVDAASVYANTSTAFCDGAEYGLGAEIGISTQKLHARGPMGLRELTSYKWVVRGEGQVRSV